MIWDKNRVYQIAWDMEQRVAWGPGFDALEWIGKSVTWMKLVAHVTHIVIEGHHI
jgi:hypothetical protein